jgi:2-dehydro-3-deoxygluconokinase
MKNIYIFGECMIELKSIGENTFKQSFAGDIYNTAVYLKRLFPQIKVNIVTAIGTDNFSQAMLKTFKNEQLNTDFVFTSTERIAAIHAIELDKNGERSFCYWRENSAARSVMQYIDDSVIETMCQGDMFFFSGIALGAIFPEDRPLFWAMLDKLKAAGVKIAFDLNFRAKLWPDIALAQQSFKRAFQAADILLPGVEDFATVFNIDTVEGVINFFKDYQYQTLIIKNGEKNVYCLTADQTSPQIVEVTPVENVVDTTSAGDSFNGAFIGAQLAGQSLESSVKLANEVAGFVIQHTGAIVDKAEFSKRFNPIV